MKSIALKLFLTVVLSVFAFSSFAASENKRYAVVVKPEIKLSEVSEPKVNFSSALPIPQTSKSYFNAWTMILVDFTVNLKEVTNNEKVLKAVREQRNVTLLKSGDKPDWLDNVDVSVKSIFETMSGDTKQHVMLSNTTKLYSLRLNGSRHLVLFFLPPHIVDRYYIPHPSEDAKPKRENKDKDKEVFRYRKLYPRNLMVEVVISAGGVEFAREYLNVKFSKDESKLLDEELKRAKGKNQTNKIYLAWCKKKFSTLENNVNYNYLEGALLSKGQSPWAYYNYDQFDLEKNAR